EQSRQHMIRIGGDLDHRKAVGRVQFLRERLRLRYRAWIAIENESILAIFSVDTSGNNAVNNRIGNILAGSHELLGRFAITRILGNLLAQHIARRDLWD